jgi:phosphatidylserine decarboxylase
MDRHQYVERCSGLICTEDLIADNWVQWLYGTAREKAHGFFKAATSPRATQWLAYLQYDMPLQCRPGKIRKIIDELRIDLSECVAPVHELNTARKLFERKIKYWQCRPMPHEAGGIVSPSDAKALVGRVKRPRHLFIKEKFFSYEELLGAWQKRWLAAFAGGAFAVFRLTPEKYHYNHVPVSGNVLDIYTIDGDCHSCNPAAVVTEVTPYSKNRRVVTVIDTDVPGGTQVGRVAMVEIVALMIGEIVQCYSDAFYENPQVVLPGMFVQKGQPKSLFRPGSSVVILFFQMGRMEFDGDLISNSTRFDVQSRYSNGFQRPLVETEVQVRSSIGRKTAAVV